MRHISLLLCAAMLCSGCASSLRVDERAKGETKDLSGVPFYARKQVYKQTTTYAEQWYEVAMSLKLVGLPDKAPPISVELGNRRVPRTAETEIAAFRAKVALANIDADGLAAALEAFKVLPQYKETDDVLAVVGNQIEQVTYVDYDREMYLNALVPWFGSANIETGMGTDGTLSKVVGGQTSQPEKLAELLPFKEVLTAKLVGKEAKEFAPSAGAEGRALLEVTVKDGGFLYDVYKFHNAMIDPATPLVLDKKTSLFRRRTITAEVEKDGAAKPEKKNEEEEEDGGKTDDGDGKAK